MKKKDLILLVLSLVLTVAGAAGLISHFSEVLAGNRADGQLRETWYAQETAEIRTAPPQQAAGPGAAEPLPEPDPEEAAPAATAAPARALPARLRRTAYPDNPGLAVSERFRELLKQNGDIVGWLRVGTRQDEAVTQRDNEYYMDHDASGNRNTSGAVFLDEGISLQTRPYSLILYGHNMRNESRFGWLRKYESPDFYRNNLFIDFQTLYEEGRYVVFSEGTVSTEEGKANYLDFFGLNSLRTDERTRAIDVLQSVSVLDCGIDVRADDQILLLVTCVGDDADRRIVAARRLRDGEDERLFLE